MPWNPLSPGSTSQADNQGAASGPSVVVASAARTTSGNSTAQTAPGNAIGLFLDVTAASGTTPSLAVSVEWSNDGTNWAPADPTDNFAALTAAARRAKNVMVKAPYFRVVWAVTGTTPSFTFSVSALPVGS